MAKILISDKMSPYAEQCFLNRGIEVDVRTGMTPEELIGCIGDYNGLAVRSTTKVTAEVLEAADNLQVIGRAGIGVDNIDRNAATGKGVVVPDAYADERFNRSIDEQTGFVTKSLLCAPIRTVKGEVIGIAQVLNKQEGQFTEDDLAVLEAMTTQAALALQSTAFVERTQKTRTQEIEFLEVVSDVISELDLAALLQKVMSEATRMLQAERSTLFLNN